MMWRSVAVLFLLLVAAEVRAQDLDLGDALDTATVETTPKKPAAPTKPPVDGELPDFDLGDAANPEPKHPTPKPQPANPGGGGGGGGSDGSLSDSDLLGDDELSNDPQSGGDRPRNPSGRAFQPSAEGDPQADEGKPNVIAGIVSGVAVAAIGAVSSFIAYQKKKLCFKGSSEDPENVNMENRKEDQADPQAQSFLPK